MSSCRMDDDGGASTTRSSSAAVAEKQIIQQQQQQPSPAEKLLLSFENPNYQLERQFKSMDQARIDDHLNSNIAPANMMYDELCRELKIYTELSGESVLKQRPPSNVAVKNNVSINIGYNYIHALDFFG